MRLIRQGVAIALVGAALAVVPTATTVAAPGDPSIVQDMRAAADGDVDVTTSPATGRVSFISASDDLLPGHRSGRSASAAADKAAAYLDTYGRAFGGAGVELVQSATTATTAGTTVDFTQTYRGLPVFASKLRAQVDPQGDLTSVSGFAVPGIDVATTPSLSEADAVAKALRIVKASPAGSPRRTPRTQPVGDLKATAELSVYRTGAIQGVAGTNLLAWVLEVTDEEQVRESVVLDAVTGKVVNRYSMIAHALDRELYEGTMASAPVWEEGDPFPGGLDQDQRNEVQGTGESYWFFKNSFGRDSYDDEGAPMVTVNNDPSIQCPNANWNGVSTNYCSGVSSDDTVAHEWAHAYTEYTSGLLYQWQPGAMNEGYSDIWGETVDMLNDRFNESENEIRAVGDCTKYSFTNSVAISIVAPAPIAGDCVAVKASGGPAFPATPTNVEVIVGRDEVDDEVEGDLPTDGCSPFTNAAAIDGKWVYVDENGETFCGEEEYSPEYYQKLGAHAAAAGAQGLIVGSDPAYEPWDMPGATFTLPTAQIDGDSGTAIKSVPGPVTLRVGQFVPADAVDSHRWLSGEADSAFGGAIRDMWNPTCYGDPGKVSDEEYHCDTTDNGGVHINSGVVNHTYALLVDGGTSNGVTVPGIDLDKAAHVFWRAQTAYLTPTSGFAELADALEQSCVDLTGDTDLNELAIGSSATGGAAVAPTPMAPISGADCDAVEAAVLATELRVEPEQCNFQPMFKPGTVRCGAGTTTSTVWKEGFESGLPSTWDQTVVPADAHLPATVTTTLPEVTDGGTQHTGGPSVLYFNDKGSFGTCEPVGNPNDHSSRVSVTTPALTVPSGSLPRLSFDHYMASEVGWDGGNVKVSVGSGPFRLVPQSAWLLNAPGGVLEPVEEGSTNPMAGEPAFTGTDGGEPTGAWGTSVINLASIAAAGTTVRFRFDFGMDGCNGIDGWYVDNVTLSVCKKPAPAPVTATVAGVATAKKGNITFKVRAPGQSRIGPITVTIKGKRFTGTAVNGKLVIKAKKALKKVRKPSVKASVSFRGSATVKPFAARVKVKIRR